MFVVVVCYFLNVLCFFLIVFLFHWIFDWCFLSFIIINIFNAFEFVDVVSVISYILFLERHFWNFTQSLVTLCANATGPGIGAAWRDRSIRTPRCAARVRGAARWADSLPLPTAPSPPPLTLSRAINCSCKQSRRTLLGADCGKMSRGVCDGMSWGEGGGSYPLGGRFRPYTVRKSAAGASPIQ